MLQRGERPAEISRGEVAGAALSTPPAVRNAATGRSVWTRDFAINDRFFSQRVSGVQGYARRSPRPVDELLGPCHERPQLLAPAGGDESSGIQVEQV